LAAIAAAQRAFEVRSTTVGRFPGVLYLVPEPADPFLALTKACAARFPDFPPYGGTYDEVVPHLTVVDREEAPVPVLVPEIAATLPFSHHVRWLEVITPSEAGPWRVRWRLPLGRAGA
jgi:hypothetical protein